jgi:hypothetical protein
MPISLFGKRKQGTPDVLDNGWQLYAKPTTLDPVGTLFRIDDAGCRYEVDHIAVDIREGREASARVRQLLWAQVGFFARFLGLDSIFKVSP